MKCDGRHRVGTLSFMDSLGRFILASVILLTSCSGGSGSSDDDVYLAFGSDSDEVSLFQIENDEVVPTVRLGSIGGIPIAESFGSTGENLWYGLPTLRDGRVAYRVSRDGNELVFVDSKTGDKERVIRSQNSFQAEYFKKEGIFLINESSEVDSCRVLRPGDEPVRVGAGICTTTNDRIWLVDSSDNSTRLSELNSKFEPSESKRFPISQAVITSSGKLVHGFDEARFWGVFDVETTERIFQPSPDEDVSLAAVSSRADSFVVAIDADDDDELLELRWLQLRSGVLESRTIGTFDNARVSISEDGDLAVVIQEATTSPTDEAADSRSSRSELSVFSWDSVAEGPELGPEEFDGETQVSKDGSVFLEFDGTLFAARRGERLSRVGDIFGDGYSLKELRDMANSYVLTMGDSNETEVSVVRPKGDGWEVTRILQAVGKVSTRDERGSSALVTVDEGGYSTLYQLDYSKAQKLRLAEGDIRSAAFLDSKQAVYNESIGDSRETWRVSISEDPERKMISRRYQIERVSKDSSMYLVSPRNAQRFEAVVDETRKTCREQSWTIVEAGSPGITSFELTESATAQGEPTVVCVRFRSGSVGSFVPLTVQSEADLAIVSSAASIDQSGLGGAETVVVGAQEKSTQLIQVYAWSAISGTATIQVGVAVTEAPAPDVSRFQESDLTAHLRQSELCRGHAVLTPTSSIRLTVGLKADGETGYTRFCIDVGDGSSSRLVMNPIERGKRAGLSVSCPGWYETSDIGESEDLSTIKYYAVYERGFWSDRPASDDYDAGVDIDPMRKGILGTCFFTHFWQFPLEEGVGGDGEVELSLKP